MAFPETRLTLIHRLTDRRDESAWQEFVSDYWRPIYLFARRVGSLAHEDAEDIAGLTLEVLCSKELVARWLADPQSRFKTLVCGVVQNLLSNWRRAQQSQTRRVQELAEILMRDTTLLVSDSAATDFYAIWAEELLRDVVQKVMVTYFQEGRGDYFRVLQRRICGQQSIAETAAALSLKETDVQNYFRHVRQRITEHLQSAVRREVERYALGPELGDEYRREWDLLARHFEAHGGLDAAIRQARRVP